MHFTTLASGLALASLAVSKPLVRRQTPNFGGSTVNETGATHLPGCGSNTEDSRDCWTAGFDIRTDYEVKVPEGRPESDPVTYDFFLRNVTDWKGADGVPKQALLINGQFPGPVIEANWGDWIQINVHNELETEGASMHWHGIRQLNTNLMDGANGVTECPVAPGATHTYKFRATQYGTSWYHSHYSTQYGDGIWGSIVIKGPTSGNWHIDLGAYPMSDYYHKTGMQISREALSGNPQSDTIAFNGLNVNPLDKSQGQYSVTKLEKGKKHLLRLINTSVENNFHVRLAGHKMTVVATDFVPVKPLEVDSLFMGIGQRYDVIIEGKEQPEQAKYWMKVYPGGGACISFNKTTWVDEKGGFSQSAIFQYEESGSGPANDPQDPPAATCDDNTGFEPIVERSLDSMAVVQTPSLKTGLKQVHDNTTDVNVFQWSINDSTMNVNWAKPILEYVAEKNNSWPKTENVYEVDKADQWVIWNIDNTGGPVSIPHPFHLHGHDFLLISAGSGAWDGSTGLNTKNPVRRDVAMLPGNGHLVFAFKTDNPGAWLLHCHIAWHVALGLSVQFLERMSEIPKVMDLSGVEPTCRKWRENPIDSPLEPWDSGL